MRGHDNRTPASRNPPVGTPPARQPPSAAFGHLRTVAYPAQIHTFPARIPSSVPSRHRSSGASGPPTRTVRPGGKRAGSVRSSQTEVRCSASCRISGPRMHATDPAGSRVSGPGSLGGTPLGQEGSWPIQGLPGPSEDHHHPRPAGQGKDRPGRHVSPTELSRKPGVGIPGAWHHSPARARSLRPSVPERYRKTGTRTTAPGRSQSISARRPSGARVSRDAWTLVVPLFIRLRSMTLRNRPEPGPVP
jgi:hypothetical protein